MTRFLQSEAADWWAAIALGLFGALIVTIAAVMS